MEPILRTEHLTFYLSRRGGSPTLVRSLSSSHRARARFVAVLGHNGSRQEHAGQASSTPSCCRPAARCMLTAWTRRTRITSCPCAPRWAWSFRIPITRSSQTSSRTMLPSRPRTSACRRRRSARAWTQALRQVGMYDFRLHAPHLLSGGQKQRVAIAGVIAMQPKCIVLDEPTAMLDPSGRREVIDTATKLCREQGITVVLITHHMDGVRSAPTA